MVQIKCRVVGWKRVAISTFFTRGPPNTLIQPWLHKHQQHLPVSSKMFPSEKDIHEIATP